MSHFFAMLFRMKYINRWGLMRNVRNESLCEHSLDVALIAHALCVIRNTRFGGDVNPERAAVLAMFHDCSEIFTGDLPTPVKYYSPEIRDAYHSIEDFSKVKLLSMLPDDLREAYGEYIVPGGDDAELLILVKAADKIAALFKCVGEQNAGNTEFVRARASIEAAIEKMNLPETACFMEEFYDSFSLTLDDQHFHP